MTITTVAVLASEVESRLLQVLFTSVPLTFAVIHLLLWAFDRRLRRNLYFAFVAGSFAAVAFLDMQEEIVGPIGGTFLGVLQWIAISAMLLSVARFIYDLFYDRAPFQFRLLVAACAAAFVLSFSLPEIAAFLGKILVLIVVAESFRVSIIGTRRPHADVRIPAIGMGLFGISGAADMLHDLGVIPPLFGLDDPYLAGGVVMLLFMSIHLARSFAVTRRDLEAQLVRVQTLSDAMLEQERAMREDEIRRRILEADRDRKTKELDDARELQISLLPASFPELKHFEIAASMRTATEVGGDYYDFHVADDGTLTVVVGDAVGHGARSGIMVTAAKSLFSALIAEPDVATMLSRFNEAVRGMGLRRMHMAMTIARFRPDSVEIAAAAMPPPLIRRASGAVEEIELTGTPLGSWRDRYISRTVPLAPGDLVLLMSDGLPELRAGASDPLGYTHAASLLRATADADARATISRFDADLDQRLGDRSPDDDITLVGVRLTLRG